MKRRNREKRVVNRGKVGLDKRGRMNRGSRRTFENSSEMPIWLGSPQFGDVLETGKGKERGLRREAFDKR